MVEGLVQGRIGGENIQEVDNCLCAHKYGCVCVCVCVCVCMCVLWDKCKCVCVCVHVCIVG